MVCVNQIHIDIVMRKFCMSFGMWMTEISWLCNIVAIFGSWRIWDRSKRDQQSHMCRLFFEKKNKRIEITKREKKKETKKTKRKSYYLSAESRCFSWDRHYYLYATNCTTKTHYNISFVVVRCCCCFFFINHSFCAFRSFFTLVPCTRIADTMHMQ